MSLRVDFIEGLFARLTLRYGSAFMDRWGALPLGAVKEHWGRELASFAQRPEVIKHVLSLLDPVGAPTAAAFRELCASAPSQPCKSPLRSHTCASGAGLLAHCCGHYLGSCPDGLSREAAAGQYPHVSGAAASARRGGRALRP